jgi:hypothetical protein
MPNRAHKRSIAQPDQGMEKPRVALEAARADGPVTAHAAVGARELQLNLELRLAPPVTEPRWSKAQTVAFVLVSSLTLWTIIFWGGASLFAALTR